MTKVCYTVSKCITLCQGVYHFLSHIVAKKCDKVLHFAKCWLSVTYCCQKKCDKVLHFFKCRLAVRIKGVSGVHCLPVDPAVQVLAQSVNPRFLPQ